MQSLQQNTPRLRCGEAAGSELDEQEYPQPGKQGEKCESPKAGELNDTPAFFGRRYQSWVGHVLVRLRLMLSPESNIRQSDHRQKKVEGVRNDIVSYNLAEIAYRQAIKRA